MMIVLWLGAVTVALGLGFILMLFVLDQLHRTQKNEKDLIDTVEMQNQAIDLLSDRLELVRNGPVEWPERTPETETTQVKTRSRRKQNSR